MFQKVLLAVVFAALVLPVQAQRVCEKVCAFGDCWYTQVDVYANRPPDNVHLTLEECSLEAINALAARADDLQQVIDRLLKQYPLDHRDEACP